ncbi:MAG: 50S ribosomal protein L3 [Candidatus Dojkabacteria bacterium]|nr:50S ribosomal protein L3 [Candidatus Dojkabacteria bacterium]
MSVILGYKKDMTQVFDEKGRVVVCTIVDVSDVMVVGKKTKERDGYDALILGIGKKKKTKKTENFKGLDAIPKQRCEFRTDKVKDLNLENFKEGDKVSIELFKEGERVQITGLSKGKGFQGVVKRYGFHGGPRTHGQSDRERAPGSIGAGTDPGRVFKGKKMPGRQGAANVTLKNIEVIRIDKDNFLMCLKGAIPGGRNTLVKIYNRK